MSSAFAHEPKLGEVRNVAEGTNNLVLLREIQALDVLYYVGKRKPISELTPEQQEKVREAYKDTHWASDYGVEAQGVCTSRELAEQLCRERGSNYFIHALPINSLLPDETTFFRAHLFPASDAAAMYENLEGATQAVPVTYLRMIEDEVQQLRRQVQDLLSRTT